MKILIGLLLVVLALGLPLSIYTRSSHRSCRGCALGGCLGPVLGFLLLLVAVSVAGEGGEAPDFGGLFLLPFFAFIGAITGAVVGWFLQELED